MLLIRRIRLSGDKLVALVGLDDVVMSTKDATLVARKDRVQDAKVIASELKMRDGLSGSYTGKSIGLGVSMTD